MHLHLKELFTKRFYFFMAVVVTAIVSYGFGRAIDTRLLNPPSPRPAILYVHTFVFSIWIILFLVQTGLLQARNIRSHKLIGLFSLPIGGLLPIIGIWVAIVMSRFNISQGAHDQATALLVPFFDMALFTVLFGLAVYWRKSPEFHKRMMFLAAASLTVAAFARFPNYLVPKGWFDLGFDALVLLGIGRDLWIEKRIHKVYLICLPTIIVGQLATEVVRRTPWWIGVANEILR